MFARWHSSRIGGCDAFVFPFRCGMRPLSYLCQVAKGFLQSSNPAGGGDGRWRGCGLPLMRAISLSSQQLLPTGSLQVSREGSRGSVAVGLLAAALFSAVLIGCSSKAGVESSGAEASIVDASEQTGTGDTASESVTEDSTDLVPPTPADESVASQAPVAAPVNQITGDDLVEVKFDFPDTPRALNEVERPIADGTKRLALKVSRLTYHGVVCGFSIKGARPESPALIRMTGTKADGTGFDSGAVSVAWTSTEPPQVSSGGADNNEWNFLSDANVNRSGPGWVVSLGGVTPDGPDSIPTSAACSLELGTGTFSSANGPIGYWAGFARN